MKYSPDTSLSELLEQNAISRRAYNALAYRGMLTVDDVLRCQTAGRLKPYNFSKKAFREIQDFIEYIIDAEASSTKSDVSNQPSHESGESHNEDKNPSGVIFYYDSSLEFVQSTGFLSPRAFGALFHARVRNVRELIKYRNKGWLDRHHFSLAALMDIDAFFDRLDKGEFTIIRRNRNSTSSTSSPEATQLVHDAIVTDREARAYSRAYVIMAYDNIMQLHGVEVDFLRDYFSCAQDMADDILSGRYDVLTVHKELGKVGNVALRRILIHYLNVVRIYALRSGNVDSGIIASTDKYIKLLTSNLNSFTYEEKEQYFLSNKSRRELEQLFQEKTAEMSAPALSFQQEVLPSLTHAIKLFGLPEAMIAERVGYRLSKSVLYEMWLLIQDMEDAFCEEMESGKDCLLYMKINRHFSRLHASDRRFIFQYHQENDTLPLFFIMFQLLRCSEERELAVYALYHGINSEPLSLEDIGMKLNLTRERVRQLCEKGGSILRNFIGRYIDYGDYDNLLDSNYITEMSPKYRMIQEEEELPQDFEVFCSLLSVIGDFKKVTIGEKRIAVHQRLSRLLYVNHIVNKLKYLSALKRFSEDKFFDLHSFVEDLPAELQDDAFWIVCQVAKTFPELPFDENGMVTFKKNYVDVPEVCCQILETHGKPMYLEELFQEFKRLYPTHKYVDAKSLRAFLLNNNQIRPVGKTGTYGLASWENVFFGSIRDLLRETLGASHVPMHINALTKIVLKHFPTTNAKNLMSTMGQDKGTDFVVFKGGYYGLVYKAYPSKYKLLEADIRYTFGQRLKMLEQFISTYRRFPFSVGGDTEQGLQRWLYHAERSLGGLTNRQKARLNEMLQPFRDAHLPENMLEESFLEMCELYKAYIEHEYELPSYSSNQELYDWMKRAKASYNSYIDNRRHYLTELLNYIKSLGFSI